MVVVVVVATLRDITSTCGGGAVEPNLALQLEQTDSSDSRVTG